MMEIGVGSSESHKQRKREKDSVDADSFVSFEMLFEFNANSLFASNCCLYIYIDSVQNDYQMIFIAILLNFLEIPVSLYRTQMSVQCVQS